MRRPRWDADERPEMRPLQPGVEQDVTYWASSGRTMLMEAIRNEYRRLWAPDTLGPSAWWPLRGQMELALTARVGDCRSTRLTHAPTGRRVAEPPRVVELFAGVGGFRIAL